MSSFAKELSRGLQALEAAGGAGNETIERIRGELDFAAKLAAITEDQRAAWEDLVLSAAKAANKAFSDGAGPEAACAEMEAILAPLSTAAKQYTIHVVGHAHIDMNWLWGWPETVATVNDTFATVDRLMDEFPAFHFSQSQTSVYQIMKDYLPELYARVKKRVEAGRWEVTASQWVEGDKNLAGGEILCRHLLHTRRFFRQEFGLPYDAVKVDWEPDTFGHMHTLPGILARGGVRHYYFHRSAEGPELFVWQGRDGSRLLAFDDRARGYNGSMNANVAARLCDFAKATGLKDYLFVMGVGDHGGGPTRRDLVRAIKMDQWPVFPNIKLSTVKAFFSAAELQAKNLPVVNAELNHIFEGCYTSQSGVKRANRGSENALAEAEMCALLGRGLLRMPYPAGALEQAWRKAMFNQFHDILPGSGVHATYEYAQGLFQDILAATTMIKTRALRAIAAQVDTTKSCACGCEGECKCVVAQAASLQKTGAGKMPALRQPGDSIGPGIGAGPGDIPRDGALSRRGAGSPCCDAFVAFNPSPWKRSEAVTLRLWDRKHPDGEIIVKDDAGQTFPAQVLDRGNYWGHDFVAVAVPVRDVPALGWRSFCVGRSAGSPGDPEGRPTGCSGDRKGRIENEFFAVEVEQASGAIIHLVDKRTGIDLVPPGGRLGVLEYYLEAPHPMTAWIMGQIVKVVPFLSGATVEFPHVGPHLAAVRAHHKFGDSKFAFTISLAAGVPRVDFNLEADWLERGSPELGVPMLRVAFPLALTKAVASFECANGHVTRSTNPAEIPSFTSKLLGHYFSDNAAVDPVPAEVPAQRWMDLAGWHEGTAEPAGATLLNDSKYGHSVNGSTARLTLLRSSYDPDPLPELGHHTIRFALRPHVGEWSAGAATRAGYDFNLPFNVAGAGMQKGKLPARKGCAEILTPNIMLSGMKKAEDGGALVVRLYETEGRATTARLKLDSCLAAPDASVVETDILERPLKENSAKMARGTLSVKVPPFGTVTVKVK